MVKLYDEMRGQNFEILAVNVQEDPQKVQPFAQDLKIDFPVLLDKDGKIAQAYYVRGLPTTILIDEKGIIQIVHVGTLSEKVLRGYVNRIME